MDKWLVKLKGDDYDLQYLMERFKSPFLTIKQDKDSYYLKCNYFNQLNDVNEVYINASELVEKINMILKADLGVYSLKIDDIEQVENQSRIIHTSADLRTTVRILSLERLNLNYDDLIKFLYKNKVVEDAFTFYFLDTNWFNLFKVWETIAYDVGINLKGDKENYNADQIMGFGKGEIINKGWAEKNEVELFKCTAHNRKGAGREARHSIKEKINKHCKKILSSNEHMTLGEAQSLIKKILKNWIKTK